MQYSTLIDYTRLFFYTYTSLNPTIHLIFLDLEASNSTNVSRTEKCCYGSSKNNEFLEETFNELKYDDLSTTVKVTYLKLVKAEKIAQPTVFCVPVDIHNSFPAEDGQKSANQLNLKNSQFVPNKMEKEQIGGECYKKLSNEKVNFCETVQIKYYEIDSSDES